MGTPRGIRNNNPGNLRKSGEKWQGEVDGSDPAFKTFSTPAYGIRAIAKLLLNYEARYGLNTVSGLINRWAPPNENDTSAYAKFVSSRVGVDPFATLSVVDHLPALVAAIIEQENGQQPYSPAQIAEGCQLATGGEDEKTAPVLAPTPAQSQAPVVPAPRLRDEQAQGGSVGRPVGEVDLPTRARLIAILKTLSRSKTMAGVAGMLGLQILGPDGLDWGFYHGNDLFSLASLSPYISTILAALATWGRISAKPIKGAHNA